MARILSDEEFNNILLGSNIARSAHNELDLQLIEDQRSNGHFNPFTERFRYKVYNKETGRLKGIILAPRLTSQTSLIEPEPEKWKYTPYPYHKFSPRQLVWWFKRNKIRAVYYYRKLIKSKTWLTGLVVGRGVITLLIAYLIWGLWGEQILKLFGSLI